MARIFRVHIKDDGGWRYPLCRQNKDSKYIELETEEEIDNHNIHNVEDIE